MKKLGQSGPFVVAFLAIIIACRKYIIKLASGPTQATVPAAGSGVSFAKYGDALLVPNYFDNGFIRRGLSGTITYLIDGGSAVHSGLSRGAFHLLGATVLAIALAVLLRRLAARGGHQWLWFGGFVVVSQQTFFGWSNDLLRPDMLVAGLIAWAVVAATHGRFGLAAVLLFIGSLAHETAIIFGGPLLLALWFVAYRREEEGLSKGVAAFGLLGVLLIAAALVQASFSDSLPAIAATVHAGLGMMPDVANGPVEAGVDIAVFLTWGGVVAIRDTLCGAAAEDSLAFVICSSFVVLLLNFRVLLDRSWLVKGVFAFASLMPMIFISTVAVDFGRWTMFAVTNAWLAAVALRIMGIETAPVSRRDYAIGLGVLAALTAMGPARFRTPSYATRLVETQVYGPWPGTSGEWLTRCHPDWRQRLRLAPAGQPSGSR